MAKKKVTVATALAACTLLAGCANGDVAGLGLKKTDGFEYRDKVIISAEVLTENEDGAEEPTSGGKVRVFLDQKEFEGNEAKLSEGHNYFELTHDEAASLSGHVFYVKVYAEKPDQIAKCEVKGTGILHPLHSSEAEGLGSATCVLKVD